MVDWGTEESLWFLLCIVATECQESCSCLTPLQNCWPPMSLGLEKVKYARKKLLIRYIRTRKQVPWFPVMSLQHPLLTESPRRRRQTYFKGPDSFSQRAEKGCIWSREAIIQQSVQAFLRSLSLDFVDRCLHLPARGFVGLFSSQVSSQDVAKSKRKRWVQKGSPRFLVYLS